jgi:heme exporter protein C
MATDLSLAPELAPVGHPTVPPVPRRWPLRALTVLAITGVGATVVLGLWVTPNDAFLGSYVRLLYIHPPMAWVSFLAYGVAFFASLGYLWPRTRSLALDRIAASSVEVGVVFTGLTLITGSIWGRPTWGTWWVWDPLLTTTALLFVLYIGYLVLRHLPGDPHQRARRSAISALIAFVDVPVVYFSVYWWQSLHQRPSIDNLITHKTTVHGSMAWTLLLGFCSFTLTFAVLVVHRIRLARLEDDEEDLGLEAALAERRSEAVR